MRWILFVALCLLAGCAEEAVGDADEEGFLAAHTSATTGAIRGVVVDEAIRPVSGARVHLVGTDQNVTTADEGRFAFEDLAPGVVFLEASATRHLAAQVSATVVAGKTEQVSIALPSDGLPDPFYQTHQFQGAITFHATVAWAQVEWMADTYAGVSTPACEHCVFAFESDAVPDGHVFEAVWEESTPDPRGPDELYWSYAVPEPYQELFGYAPSPIYQTWEAGAFEEETRQYKVMLLGDVDGVSVDQPFEIFLTQWFNTGVPDGWSVVQGSS